MDTKIKLIVESIINSLVLPARIVGGIFLMITLALLAFKMIVKTTDNRSDFMDSLPSLIIASFILGTLSLILGFFNSF